MDRVIVVVLDKSLNDYICLSQTSVAKLTKTQRESEELLFQKTKANQLRLELCLRNISEGERQRRKLFEENQELKSSIKAVQNQSENNLSAREKLAYDVSITLQDVKNKNVEISDKLKIISQKLHASIKELNSSVKWAENKSNEIFFGIERLARSVHTINHTVINQSIDIADLITQSLKLRSKMLAVQQKTEDNFKGRQLLAHNVSTITHSMKETDIEIARIKSKTQNLDMRLWRVHNRSENDYFERKQLAYNISSLMQLVEDQNTQIFEIKQKEKSFIQFSMWQ